MQLMFILGAVIAVCCSDVASVRIPSCIDSNQAATTAAPRPAFDEPVCKNKTCKDYAECLVAETCTSPDSCILEPLCMKREPRSDAEKGCQVGEPLIQEAFHGYQYYSCWKGEHCPKGFICGPQNVCCRPPGPDVKSGACPPMYWEFEPCENKCKSDADCPGDHKCCQTSPSCPKKECTFPDTGSLGHMCSYKICSYKYDCRLSIRRSCLRKLDMHFPPGLLRKFLEGR